MKQLLILSLMIFSSPALAHHLDDYDAKIRKEANLPTKWFSCKTADDCVLVSVPCKSDMAVSKIYSEEAQESLIHRYPFCLGSDVHDTEAICDEAQCMTNPVTKK